MPHKQTPPATGRRHPPTTAPSIALYIHPSLPSRSTAEPPFLPIRLFFVEVDLTKNAEIFELKPHTSLLREMTISNWRTHTTAIST